MSNPIVTGRCIDCGNRYVISEDVVKCPFCKIERLTGRLSCLDAIEKGTAKALLVAMKELERLTAELEDARKCADLWKADRDTDSLEGYAGAVRAITRHIIENQVELDPDAKRALYKDRHELYDAADSRQTPVAVWHNCENCDHGQKVLIPTEDGTYKCESCRLWSTADSSQKNQ